MKSAWKLILALVIALSLAACKTAPKAEPEAQPEPEAPTTGGVDTRGAPDPRDYTDSRNFDNPESLLSKRVIYFDFDKSTVRPEFRGIVSAHAAYAAAHSTAREYNLGLGERRGNAVSGLMSAQGAMGNQLTVVSYGEERPTCRVSDEECWSLNRRVEIVYTAR